MKNADVMELANMIAPPPPKVFVMMEWDGDRWDVEFDHNGRAYYAIAAPLWHRMRDVYYMEKGVDFGRAGLDVQSYRGEYVVVGDMQEPPSLSESPPDPDSALRIVAFRVGERSADAQKALESRPFDPHVIASLLDRVVDGDPPLMIGQLLLRRLAIWVRFLARRDEARARYAAPSPG